MLIGVIACVVPSESSARTLRQEQNCLALSIYWEARGESRRGMIAVGWTVINRVQSKHFPSAPCDVVRQGGEQSPCQFSWWCDGRSDRPRDRDSWRTALLVAARLLVNPPPDPTGGALWYHADYVHPRWRRALKRNRKIGAHIFYMHNARSKAAWARPELPDEEERTIQVSQLNEALTLDPID